MKIYCLQRQQVLPITPQQAWDFFSDPRNLAMITPDWLDFRITSPLPARMYAGMLVSYRVHPLAKIAMAWTTEITQLREPEFFIDEQRFGPYRFWHHQHHFEPIAGGVCMTDKVHYALPFGVLGRLLHAGVVEKKLEEIFGYRRRILEQHFGSLQVAGETDCEKN